MIRKRYFSLIMMILILNPLLWIAASMTWHKAKGWGSTRDEACESANRKIPKTCYDGEIITGEMNVKHDENNARPYYCEIEYACEKK